MFNIQTKAKVFSAFGMKCLLCRRIQATETPLDKCVLNTRHKTTIIVEHSFEWQYKYISKFEFGSFFPTTEYFLII